jgi:hypothetical protein
MFFMPTKTVLRSIYRWCSAEHGLAPVAASFLIHSH